MVGITRSKIIFKDGGRRIHDDNPKFVAWLQFSNSNSVLTFCAFPRDKMPEYDHLFQTTQQQVDLLCIFLVARVLLGYGLALPNPISKIPFDVDGTGAWKPKSRAWTIGSLLGKLKCNWWPQDRTTVAAKEVLQANPGQYFTNLYLMILMSTEAFAKILGQRLWKHIFHLLSAFFCFSKATVWSVLVWFGNGVAHAGAALLVKKKYRKKSTTRLTPTLGIRQTFSQRPWHTRMLCATPSKN